MKETLEQFAAQIGCRIDCFDLLESTNDTARDPDYDAGAVILAERQSRGRGQRGNSWSSQGGENLTFSVVLCPSFLRADRQFYLSKAVALALTDAIEALGTRAQIKWPNDCYIDGRKVAGILIENDLAGSYLARSIVGIGLNVNQTAFDPTLPNPVSLAVVQGSLLNRASVFKTFYKSLSVRYGQLQQEAFETLDSDYLSRLYRLGEENPFIDGKSGEPFLGTICGVLPAGELEVKRRDGTTDRYLFKEIEYVIK